jgi:spore maturation protein CgeB/Tfp pilus assembly protein PilF/cyclopropane fatty-acyl-phospholipid synthase-like methyltransferase
MKLKILTFNWHEPYICLLSRMNHEFLVVEPEIVPGHYRKWDQNMRPVPNNVCLISMEQALKNLEQGEFDCIIAHNVKDLINVIDYSLPKIMVFHNCLSTEIKLGKNKINRKDYLQKITPLLNGVTKVFISEMKKADWDIQGEVVLPGLDVSQYGGYTGNVKRVLRVGNLLKERDLMMGYSFGEKVLKGYRLLTLGMNPEIPKSRISDGFDDLIEQFKNNRVYINTTVDGFEDGYNLAMLEAMATGMPVVTSQNKTSPICDGVNGFISNDTDYLSRCIEKFMQDPELAKEMGGQAKKTVMEKFPINKFIQSWENVIELAINNFLKRTGINLLGETTPFADKSRKNILMDFVSYPSTTAHYMERALRQNHNVMTCGDHINDEVKKCWDLEALNWEVTPQDIPRGKSTPLRQVLDQLPQGWKPDFYFWLETGLSVIPADLQKYDFPKVCYLIDTHINYEKHVGIANNFDFIFLAQKAYVEKMKKAGLKNVFWLPLACDPDIHGKIEQEKKWDVGFVGTIPKAHNRRKTLLKRIGSRFNLNCERKFMTEMAEHYSASKIVYNNAINNDLNMRVFEALCSGSLLLTDSASGSGLKEMFENGKHLIIYEDENIENLLAHYLENDMDRELIAEQGRCEVLKYHTYAHRAEDLINVLNSKIREQSKESIAMEKPENYYKNIRHDLIPLVPEDANCILEVGCAEGMTGNELKKRPNVFVAGIENNKAAAEMARKVLDDVIVGDIESMDIPYSPSAFDCIIFADVLEHLVNPLDVLKKMSKLLNNNGTVIISIPNVQFYGVVHQLVEGSWTYQKEGILDETHLRFFTFKEIEKLVKEAGLSIQKIEETLDPQYENFSNDNHTTLKFGRLSIDGLTPEEIRRFFVFQYKIIAGKAVINTNNEISGKNMSIEQILTVALDQFDKAKYETAIGRYKEALELDSTSPEALVGVGNCCMRLQNPQEAKVYFNRAKTHDSRFYKAWLGLGLLELYKENIKQAENYLIKAIELNPQSDKAFCAMGILKNNTNDLDESEKYYCQALDINVDNVLAIKSLIEISYKTENFNRAQNYLRLFLEIHPANINMLFAMAGIQFKRGEVEDSLQTLDELLLLDPKHQYALDFQNSVRTVTVE